MPFGCGINGSLFHDYFRIHLSMESHRGQSHQQLSHPLLLRQSLHLKLHPLRNLRQR